MVQKIPYSYFNIFLSAHTSLPLLCGPQNPELQKQLLLPAKLPTGRGPRQAPSVHTFCLLLLKASAGLCWSLPVWEFGTDLITLASGRKKYIPRKTNSLLQLQ